jgi:hypothetical protein
MRPEECCEVPAAEGIRLAQNRKGRVRSDHTAPIAFRTRHSKGVTSSKLDDSPKDAITTASGKGLHTSSNSRHPRGNAAAPCAYMRPL